MMNELGERETMTEINEVEERKAGERIGGEGMRGESVCVYVHANVQMPSRELITRHKLFSDFAK